MGRGAPSTAAKALQVHVSQLRKLLEPGRTPGGAGDVIQTRPHGYLLRVDAETFDLAGLEELSPADSRDSAAAGPAAGLRRGRQRPTTTFTDAPC